MGGSFAFAGDDCGARRIPDAVAGLLRSGGRFAGGDDAADSPGSHLCCGVAGGRKVITPELIAINYRRAAIADNADVLYAGEKIDPKRPDAHMTRLNVLRMVDAMKSAGLPADLSLTAGAYVCNDLYFALLDRGLTVGGEGVFVHVPTEDVVSAVDAAKGLEICLRTALEG